MRSRPAVFAFILFTVSHACAQAPSPLDQLPLWAHASFSAFSKREAVEISNRLNPFVWRGDFDGDGRMDLAILVKHSRTKKEGIAILRRKGAALLVGAGKDFGNGGDDFSWIDLWFVEDRGTLQRSHYEKPVRLSTDGLVVAKEGSASALIYLRNGKPKWQQQGD